MITRQFEHLWPTKYRNIINAHWCMEPNQERVLKSEILWSVYDVESDYHGPKHKVLDYTLSILNGNQCNGKKQYGKQEFDIVMNNLNYLQRIYKSYLLEEKLKRIRQDF